MIPERRPSRSLSEPLCVVSGSCPVPFFVAAAELFLQDLVRIRRLRWRVVGSDLGFRTHPERIARLLRMNRIETIPVGPDERLDQTVAGPLLQKHDVPLQ